MPSTGGRAWDKVKPQTVNNCWTKGLDQAFQPRVLPAPVNYAYDFPGFTDTDVAEAKNALYVRGFDVNLSPANLDAWSTIDNDVPKSHLLSDSEIVASVQSTTPEPDSEPEEDTLREPLPHVDSVIEGFVNAKRWLKSQLDCSCVVPVSLTSCYRLFDPKETQHGQDQDPAEADRLLRHPLT